MEYLYSSNNKLYLKILYPSIYSPLHPIGNHFQEFLFPTLFGFFFVFFKYVVSIPIFPFLMCKR